MRSLLRFFVPILFLAPWFPDSSFAQTTGARTGIRNGVLQNAIDFAGFNATNVGSPGGLAVTVDANGLVTNVANTNYPSGHLLINGVAVDTSLGGKALDSAVVHNTGNETVAGTKTFSSAPAVPDNSFAESKVTSLVTDLSAKALDSAVVHNTGAETVAGVKTFSSAPVVPSASFPESATTNLVTDLAGKEPIITAGTSSQYFRGDKTFQTLNTAAVPESGSLYYTNARAIAAPLTGFVSGAGTITGTDSILVGIQKNAGNIAAIVTPANTTSTASQWLNSYNSTTGALTKSQPAESDLSFTDITTNNVSTSKHGFAPKLPNDSTKFLDGTGAYSVPPNSGGTVTSFSAGNLSPLFTASVATATTTPALTFSLTNAAANTFFGNGTGSSAAPTFMSPSTAKTALAITESDVASLVSDLALKAPLASPTFTGSAAASQSFVLSGTLTPTALAADQNDYNPTSLSTATTLRIDGGTADRNVTGLAGGADGRIIEIVNIGTTNALVLKDQNASSSAANRFLNGADVTVGMNKAVVLRYDGTSSRWRAFDRALVNTGVTSGSYGDSTHIPSFTVDVQGRISSASSSTFSISSLSDAGQLSTYAGITPSSNAQTLLTHTFSQMRTDLGATTVGGNIFQLTNPSAISFVKIAADNSVSTRTPAQVLSDIGGDNASNLASGTVATARMGSGTANNTTFLRGDNTWATPAGGATIASTTNLLQGDGAGNASSAGFAASDVSRLSVASTHTANLTVSGASFGLSGNISSAAWTTNGIRYKNLAATLTDTTSSGTVAAAYTDVWGGNTIAASSATTFTDYYGSYFKVPVVGTNVTFTNAWGIGTDSLKVGTSNPFKVTSAGAVTIGGTFTLGSTAVTATGTELNYVAGVTSAIQTQLNAKQVSGSYAASGANTDITSLALTGATTNSFSGTASTPALKLSGVPFAGTGTTSFPLLYINDANATASTTLNSAGTYLGVNAHGTPDLMHLLLDGASALKVTSAGGVQSGTNGYFRAANVGGSGGFQVTSRFSIVGGGADGVAVFEDFANGNTWNRLAFGGTTSSYPSIKRNGTAINFRLADDSADAGITASTLGLTTRDSGTNTITNGLTLGHQSTGTPAAGLGEAILGNLDSSTTADQNAFRLYYSWTTATHASRTSKAVIQLVNNAAALADVLTLNGDGTANLAAAGTTAGSIATIDGTQTLTNKTINGASNTLTVRAASDITGTLPIANGGTNDTGTAWTTYTPTVTTNSGTITTLGTVSGRYKQIGKTTFVQIEVNITTNGTGAGNVQVTLPANANASNRYELSAKESLAAGFQCSAEIDGVADQSKMFIRKYDATYPGSSGCRLIASGVYEAN